jgi:parallel beta-helix repeat protein
MTLSIKRGLTALVAGGVMMIALLLSGASASAVTSQARAATTTTTTTTPPNTAPSSSVASKAASKSELASCGIGSHAKVEYHGTNAERKLHRAVPDPLSVVVFPCNFSAGLRGIRLNSNTVQLVQGGKLVRTIPLPSAGPVTLPLLTQVINDSSWVAKTAPGVFELKASLIQEAGTTLDVVAPAVTLVRMEFGHAITLGGLGATGNFSGVTVESWNSAHNQPEKEPNFGRPFIDYETNSELNIFNSTMEYLGADETSSYGVTWHGNTSGIAKDSTFQHNFFGAYTFETSHVTFEDSTFRHNVFYGIDPHTNSTDLTIVNNQVYGNLDHGIVFSRFVTNSVVSGNHVYDNTNNGIMMDYFSNGNVISKNVVTGNGEGIVLAGSARNNVYGNTVTNNGVGIRASHQGADQDKIHNNRISGGRLGLQLYGDATATQVSNNVVTGASATGMVLDSPRSLVTANTVSGTPTAIKVLTATKVVGGVLTAQRLGISVGAEGIASVRGVTVHAATPISDAAGSVVQLSGTTFSLPGHSLSKLDIAGILVLAFAILCEILYLLRGRSVRRLAHSFRGVSPNGTSVERQLSQLTTLNVQIRRATPPRVDPTHENGIPPESNDAVRRFRPDIEGLRAIAVVFVILSHASLGLPGGFVGVDIFFVISGFLITQQLLREQGNSGRISFVKFYARRARRILPAATVVTCATLIASYYVLSPLRLSAIAKDALAAALFSVNWRLAAAGTNYFNASTPPSPFQHYWSLSVEEQFYLVWPLLIVGVALLCRKRVAIKWPLTIVLGTITAASLWASIYVTQVSAPYAYFGTHTRVWELAIGALLALWGPKLARMPRVLATVAAWAGVAAMCWAAIRFNGSTAYPGWAAQIPVYGAALVIAAGCGMAARAGPELVLGRSLFQRTGRISYSLYLWHWPLLILLPDFLGYTPTWEDRLGAVGLATILSIATYVFIEQPVRNSSWLVTKPRRALTTGVALICTCLVVALLVGSTQVASTPSGPFTTPELSAAISKMGVGGTVGTSSTLLTALKGAATADTLPSNLTPSLATASSDFGMDSHGCEVGPTATTPLLPCDEFGDPNGKTQVMLIGDSHAGMWLPAVNQLAIQNGWRLTFFSKTACLFGNYPNFVLPLPGYNNRPYTQCNAWRAAVIARINAVKPSYVIITSQARPIAAKEPRGLTQSVDAIKGSVKKVLFLADTPKPHTVIPDCLAQHLDNIKDCNIQVGPGIQSAGRLAEIAGAEAGGASVIDPAPWFCTHTICPVVIQNTLVYLDSTHITAAYALLREPQLAASIDAAIGIKSEPVSSPAGEVSSPTTALLAAVHTSVLPSDVTPSLATVASDFGMPSHGCEVKPPATAPVLPCDEFGDPNGKVHVMFVGDSHAGMWLPAVNQLALKNGWRLTFLAKTGCPFANYPSFQLAGYADRPYTECNSWRAAVIARIVAVKPSVVIVASEERSIAAQEPKGLTQSLDAIKKSVPKILFLADTPKPTSDVPDCLAQHPSDITTCNIPVSTGVENAGRLAEIAGAKAAGATVIDPEAWFCTNTTCPVVIQNTIVYLDDSHITAAYALFSEPQLAAAVNAAVAQK